MNMRKFSNNIFYYLITVIKSFSDEFHFYNVCWILGITAEKNTDDEDLTTCINLYKLKNIKYFTVDNLIEYIY